MTTEATAEPSAPRRRWRPSFTMRGLLAFATIVGLVMANCVSWWQLWKAEETFSLKERQFRQELAQLRHQAGFPVEPSPGRVQVVAIPTLRPDAWSWRVFVPGGGRMAVQFHLQDLPLEALPFEDALTNDDAWRVIGHGMSTIHLELGPAVDGKQPLLFTIKNNDATTQKSVDVAQDDLAWRATGVPYEELSAGAFRADTFVPGDRIELFRLHALDPAMTANGVVPSALVVWLHPLSSGVH